VRQAPVEPLASVPTDVQRGDSVPEQERASRLDLSDLSAEELTKFHTQRALSTYSDEEIAHRIRVARIRRPQKRRSKPTGGPRHKKKRVWF